MGSYDYNEFGEVDDDEEEEPRNPDVAIFLDIIMTGILFVMSAFFALNLKRIAPIKETPEALLTLTFLVFMSLVFMTSYTKSRREKREAADKSLPPR